MAHTTRGTQHPTHSPQHSHTGLSWLVTALTIIALLIPTFWGTPALTSGSQAPTQQLGQPGYTNTGTTPYSPTITQHTYTTNTIQHAKTVITQAKSNPAPQNGVGYTGNRTNIFGKAWLDTDGNGCDTRNDILARDLTGVVVSGGCKVQSGVLHDPYTGKEIQFKRGKGSSKVQIDHIIPLGYAYKHGAWVLAQGGNKSRLEDFANDADNLIAVDGPANGAKSDKGAGGWLPSNNNPTVRCWYAMQHATILEKYPEIGLAEKDAETLIVEIDKWCEKK